MLWLQSNDFRYKTWKYFTVTLVCLVFIRFSLYKKIIKFCKLLHFTAYKRMTELKQMALSCIFFMWGLTTQMFQKAFVQNKVSASPRHLYRCQHYWQMNLEADPFTFIPSNFRIKFPQAFPSPANDSPMHMVLLIIWWRTGFSFPTCEDTGYWMNSMLT